MLPIRRTLTVVPNQGMWKFDTAQAVPEGASPDMLNFQMSNGFIRKRPGYVKHQAGSTFPTSAITGIFSTADAAGTRRLYAVTKTGVYRYNSGTTDWDAMTGPALTAADINLVSFAVSQDNLIISNAVDNIMALPMTGTIYAALSATSFPSGVVVRWNNRLYAAYTVESSVLRPYRVRWSVNSDHTDWVGVGAGFTDLVDDVYPIREMRKIASALAIYTSSGIIMASKTGAAAGPASFDQTVFDIGLYSPMSLQARNTLHFFIGTDNFYSFNGLQLAPLVYSVRQYVFSLLNPAQALQNFAFMLTETQEYVACVATGSNTAVDMAWIYNWSRNIAYPWQFAAAKFTCATLHVLDSSVLISELVGTIAEQGWIIGGHTLSANYPTIILGGNDSNVYQLSTSYLSDDGEPILCRWTSRDYVSGDIDPSLAGHMVTMHSVGVSYVDPGVAFTLNFYFSTDQGATWLGPYPLTLGGVAANALSDAQLTQQTTGKRVRFKVENNTDDELPQISCFYPEIEQQKQKIA